MADVTMRVNDLLPYLDATLKDANGGVDLTNETVRFVMRNRANDVIFDQTSTGAQVVILAATSGRVRFKWSSSGMDTAGNFLAEFETTNASTERKTFPNDGHIEIVLTPELST